MTSQHAVDPVLLIDDDPALCRVLELGLTEAGYLVDVAGSAAEAERLIAARSYSVALCDFEMPGANGLELVASVIQRRHDLPFIMLTGYDHLSLARSAMAVGAVDFVPKPVEIRNLVRVIEQNRVRQDREREHLGRVVREGLRGAVRALVAAVDAKDPRIASHSERVSRMAVQVATTMALPPERLELVEYAALLHDVGKIAVPEQILEKRTSLSSPEQRVFQRHAAQGAAIVTKMGAVEEMARIVRQHHERMDGKGYPDGLTGDRIHPLARLVAVADCYDNLTCRQGLSRSVARDSIAAAIGTHLDPFLGQAFLDLDPTL